MFTIRFLLPPGQFSTLRQGLPLTLNARVLMNKTGMLVDLIGAAACIHSGPYRQQF